MYGAICASNCRKFRLSFRKSNADRTCHTALTEKSIRRQSDADRRVWTDGHTKAFQSVPWGSTRAYYSRCLRSERGLIPAVYFRNSEFEMQRRHVCTLNTCSRRASTKLGGKVGSFGARKFIGHLYDTQTCSNSRQKFVV